MYYFDIPSAETISARALVLSLLASINVREQSIGRLIHAGSLFDIEPATIRVAVTRLMQSRHLESPERGVYAPGPKAKALTRRVQQWKDAEALTVDWDGSWLIALTRHLGRTDRKQVRARERALALSGYQQTAEGFWVRPGNLARDIGGHRSDLISIGADGDIHLHRAIETAPDNRLEWPALWSAERLKASYKAAIGAMQDSLARLPDMSKADGARETLLIGQAVIRAINFDPLLPPELGDETAFRRMVDTMKLYNETGIACWNAFQAEVEATDQ